ncbi:STAS domain-containing protein [Actinokineospora iranica]|uniref:Anti-anti-sigma factor n=1 Tax=Actinokineospora iranica TaxID=1271860 RepID=A0A1G6IQS6_9PSEU|nr:STAS domain-containing protein [Actinokineospora iranica]SDC08922.1 anti-anti-sigma factor [Actinokineospora iranica]
MALSFARSAEEQALRELTITVDRDDRTAVIGAVGRIDLATETPWHDEVMTASTADDGTTRVVIDLTAVTFLSWASTAVLVRANRACRRRGRTLRVLACGPVLTGLQLTHLPEDITITPSARTAPTPAARATSSWLIA